MTNETTPDAVERQYQDSDGNPCDLVALCRREPEWAASRLTFERARHAEEVAEERRLKELKRQETVSLQGAVRKLMDQLEAEEARVAHLRDQLRKADAERRELQLAVHRIGDQLRKVEGERDRLLEKAHTRGDQWRSRCDAVRDDRDTILAELTSLRSLLPDVRACAEWIIESQLEQPHDAADPIVDVAKRLYERPISQPSIPRAGRGSDGGGEATQRTAR